MKKILIRLLYMHHERKHRYRFCIAIRFPNGGTVKTFRLARWDVYYDETTKFVTSIQMVTTCYPITDGMFWTYKKISKRNSLYKIAKKYFAPHLAKALQSANNTYEAVRPIDLYIYMNTRYYHGLSVSAVPKYSVDHSYETEFFRAVLKNAQKRNLAKVPLFTNYSMTLLPKITRSFERIGTIKYDKPDTE